MSLYIVIDGYNLIRQSPALSDIDRRSLERGRQALLERLSSYRRVKHHTITVVFDGADADIHMERRTRWKGISVVFSRPGELADGVIKHIVTRERERAVVVTSDKEVADFAAEHGAATMGSLEFENKMRMAVHHDPDLMDFNEEKEVGWVPTTRKKGPSRRLSKRKRKSRSRTRKV